MKLPQSGGDITSRVWGGYLETAWTAIHADSSHHLCYATGCFIDEATEEKSLFLLPLEPLEPIGHTHAHR